MKWNRSVISRYRSGLWTGSLVVLLVVGINLSGWLFYQQVWDILDDGLSRSLQSLSTVTALTLDYRFTGDWEAYSEDTQQQIEMNRYLEELRQQIRVPALYLISPAKNKILAQAKDKTLNLGDPLLLVDQMEIDSAFAGVPAAGLVFPVRNQYFKRGYAPIHGTEGNVVAVLGVESGVTFMTITRRIQDALYLFSGISFILIILAIYMLHRVYRTSLRLEEQMLVSDKYQSLAQLSAGVAHEIRNPLGIISGNAELLHDELVGQPSLRPMAGNILEETERMNKILSNYMDFARPSKLQNEPVSPKDVIAKSVQLCRYQLEKANITVVEEYQEPISPVRGDAGRIRQVFLNLILNARDAMSKGGTLTTRVIDQDRWVQFEIIDTGSGIPRDQLDKVFDPFYTTKNTGSGLGLAIARRIIEDHQGNITIESHPGKGTVVRVRLPHYKEK